MNMSEPSALTLGVLQCEGTGTLPFAEAEYCRKLCIAGRKHGIRVIVFSPLWIHWGDCTVHAFVYEKSGWERRTFPLPGSLMTDAPTAIRSNTVKHKLPSSV
ncbi:hypothetical protein [Paenibacillus sp. E194]|uniref:hypothetical protein n=1 Tax=Paenibacillus sp. E194 TaxID=1458845 RepID=UPI000A5CF11B|nr:hypothetical protein [Paenibacillus sp. E194]